MESGSLVVSMNQDSGTAHMSSMDLHAKNLVWLLY